MSRKGPRPSDDATPILPGATIGVLGSGQLGRMLALEARRMGYRVHTFSPGSDTPTGQVADREVTAAYEDLDAVRDFASDVDVVTFEFENVHADATAAAAAVGTPVRPAGRVLHITQNRLREKTFLAGHGFPVTPFRAVRSVAALEAALAELATPAVLKTAGWGYDGKGQVKIDDAGQAAAAFAEAGLDADEAAGNDEEAGILEAFVPFELELSVVAARGLDGAFAHFGVMANDHANHVLDVTTTPAPVPAPVAQVAVELARDILTALDVVGVLCVEMFWKGADDGAGDESDTLLVNELAPRPHNSGHLTIEAHETSQFEQQLRTVCGLPLGATTLRAPAAMANLSGDLWHGDDGTVRAPDWRRGLEMPGVHLHLYGKKEPRPGRKMGHLTALGGSVNEARDAVLEARRRLGRK